MARVSFLVVIALIGSCLAIAPSRADHMNGVYAGTAAVTGYVLQLTQRGTALQATLTGPAGDTYQLVGSTDGGDYGQGSFSGSDYGSFELYWASQGVTLDYYGAVQSGRAVFVSGGAGAGAPAARSGGGAGDGPALGDGHGLGQDPVFQDDGGDPEQGGFGGTEDDSGDDGGVLPGLPDIE